MPTVPIYPLSETRSLEISLATLPQVLQTPSGLAIVEIQGTVKFSATVSPQQDETRPATSSIGRLVFPYYDETNSMEDTSWQKRVHLYVGKYQRLTGEVKKLANPIAVLRRRQGIDERDELEIAEIVHYKLLFAHRPEPVGGGNE